MKRPYFSFSMISEYLSALSANVVTIIPSSIPSATFMAPNKFAAADGLINKPSFNATFLTKSKHSNVSISRNRSATFPSYILGTIAVYQGMLGEWDLAEDLLRHSLDVIRQSRLGASRSIQQKIRLGHILQYNILVAWILM